MIQRLFEKHKIELHTLIKYYNLETIGQFLRKLESFKGKKIVKQTERQAYHFWILMKSSYQS